MRATRISYRLGSGAPSVQFSIADDGLGADIDVDYRASKAPRSLFNGHLTSSNSDVRSGDNARRHERRWNGFANWWSDVFGGVKFGDHATKGPDRSAARLPGRRARCRRNRPANASIPDVADAVQEFLTDWLIRRNYQEAACVPRAGRPSAASPIRRR